MKFCSFSKVNHRYRGPIESKKVNSNCYQLSHEFLLVKNECDKIRNKIREVNEGLRYKNELLNERSDSIINRIYKARSEIRDE